jgi:hypothetical protein
LAEKLSQLRANPKNPRKITDEKKEMLRKSLDEFGDMSGIVNNVRSQQLVGGHQRTDVLPPDADIIITQKYDPPTRTGTVAEGHVLIAGEKFKYREVDWDEVKELAANLAANKHAGEWNYPVLNEILIELDHANYPLELTGYTENELEGLLAPSSVPAFEPGSIDDQGKLDEKKPIECPHCGEKFVPEKKG